MHKMAKMIVICCVGLHPVPLGATIMKERGYERQHNMLSVTGASLSEECDCQLQSWKRTVCSDVELSKKMHQTNEVWFIEHEDCGAYNAYYGETISEKHEQPQPIPEKMPSMVPHIKMRLFGMDKTNQRDAKMVYCTNYNIHYVYQNNGEVASEPVDTFFSDWYDLIKITNSNCLLKA